jgi:hypothetical protein
MEVGPTFRITVPKYPTKDPNYRILANQWMRFTHYYFYIHDEVLGPIVMRGASLFPRTTYYLNGHNFIEHQLRHGKIGFRKNDNAFVAPLTRRRPTGRRRQAQPRHHSQAARLLDLHPRPEILRQGAQAGQAVAHLCYQPGRILLEHHIQRNFPIHKLFERGDRQASMY